jgi:ComF family protein
MLATPTRHALTHALHALAHATLDLLLPPHCPSCGTQIATHTTLCPPCFNTLTFITDPLCQSCGLPFASRAFAGTLRLCPHCLDPPPPWRAARAALLYDEAARALVLPLKHADRQENAATLAAFMARAGAALIHRADLLIPVPLHRRRLRARGFNQAALLAAALSRRHARPHAPDALQRTRPTPSLGALSANERAEAMANAIAIRPRSAPLIRGKSILLVDDVMTSGATAAACAQALLDGGAAHIDVLVAARVPDPRQT